MSDQPISTPREWTPSDEQVERAARAMEASKYGWFDLADTVEAYRDEYRKLARIALAQDDERVDAITRALANLVRLRDEEVRIKLATDKEASWDAARAALSRLGGSE